MQELFNELRVSNTNTYIVDSNNNEINTKQVDSGYWALAFDRDGSCFEMYKVTREYAKDSITDFGHYKLTDAHITDFANARYYWNENMCDTGILHIH